jgi:fibronectin-binding autotransporter adhesin
MGLAVVTGGAGYGVNALYSSARVNFTGANTYAGTTTLSNTVANIANTQALGTSYADQTVIAALQVGNGATIGTLGTGDVTNNGVLMFNRSNTWALTNNVSGTGAVMQTGIGETQLSGALTHTGGTRVVAGTLQVGNAATSGTLGGDIANLATVKFNRTDQQTLTNVVSGTGILIKENSNTLTLTNAQTYVGSTTVAAGHLVFQNNTSPSTSRRTWHKVCCQHLDSSLQLRIAQPLRMHGHFFRVVEGGGEVVGGGCLERGGSGGAVTGRPLASAH